MLDEESVASWELFNNILDVQEKTFGVIQIRLMSEDFGIFHLQRFAYDKLFWGIQVYSGIFDFKMFQDKPSKFTLIEFLNFFYV